MLLFYVCILLIAYFQSCSLLPVETLCVNPSFLFYTIVAGITGRTIHDTTARSDGLQLHARINQYHEWNVQVLKSIDPRQILYHTHGTVENEGGDSLASMALASEPSRL